MDIFLRIMMFLCKYKLKIISSGVYGNMLSWHKRNKGKQGKKIVCFVKCHVCILFPHEE